MEEDFDPLIRQLAIAAKSHFRYLAVYDTPFPPQGAGRFEYGWKAIKAMVKNSGNQSWQVAMKWTKNDSDCPMQVVKFVSSAL